MEDLQKLWQGQGIPQSFRDQNSFEILQKGLKEQQKKIRKSNWIATISLSFTLLWIIGIYFLFPNQSIFFYAGIIITSIDLVVFSTFIWLGLATQKFDAAQNQKEFAHKAISKLKVQLFLRQKGILIYGLVLLMGLSVYYLDFVPFFTWWQSLLVYGLTYGYFILISFFTIKRKRQQTTVLQEQLFSWEELLKSEG